MNKCLFMMVIVFAGFQVLAAESDDQEAVQNCLSHWKKHPFHGTPKFKTIASRVKVMGIGGNVSDQETTKNPELVLIKPSVTVMSKTTMSLMNPNGWYCVKGKVSVLGKTEINVNCKASLASSDDGATILGGADAAAGTNTDAPGGVTVLGASRVNRIGCESKTE